MTNVGSSSPSGVAAHVQVQALWGFLRTWTDQEGEVRSPIIHRGNLKRLGNIHGTPWCQAPIIEAVAHIVAITRDERWIRELERLAVAQSRKQLPDGKYLDAGHEDDRFSSLVHNALATSALIRAARALRDASPRRESRVAQEATECVRRNITYLVGNLWDNQAGAARFDVVDHYTASGDHFVLNMNALFAGAVAMAVQDDVVDRTLLDVAARAIRFVASWIDRAGCVPYSNLRRDIEISIYTALVGRGAQEFLAATEQSADESIEDTRRIAAEVVAHCARRLLTQQRPDGAFVHGETRGNRVESPVFIAGAGIAYDFLLDAGSNAPSTADLRLNVDRLYEDYQQPHGGLDNYRGYNTRDNWRRVDGGRVWEDVLATPGWNGFLFKASIRLLSMQELLLLDPDAPTPPRVTKVSVRYFIRDTARSLCIVGWWPLKSMALCYYSKRSDHACIWWDLRRLRALIVRGYHAN